MGIVLLKIIIFLFLTINLFSKDLVELYRTEGLSSVQKIFDEKLKDENYWLNYLSDKNVELGFYETRKYVLLTQKDQSEIALYDVENHQQNLILKNSIIIGENEGDKFKEGDKKTPIGVYDLTEKKTNLDQFYGPFALVTSYPNLFDKIQNKDGYGIWIHGMPLNQERELFTRGCIALDNPQLEELEKNIDLTKTVLLTSPSILKSATKEEISKILALIFKWKDAWKYSDIDEYLSFYSDEFQRDDGMNIDEFKKFKTRIFNKNEKKTIRLYNIDISPYPNSLGKRVFKAIMDEDYISPSVKFFGKKELYLEFINGEVKILVEG